MAETEAGIGQTIRDARVRRGLTIEQLSGVTRISPAILRAMEAENFDGVPGGVFARGFVRSCAREVGLDPEETVAKYVAQLGGGAPSSPSTPAAREKIEAPEPGGDDDLLADRSNDLTQMILIGVIVATVGYLGVHNGAHDSVAAASAPTAAEVSAVGTSGVSQSRATAVPETPELRIDLQAIGPCWLAASADGAPVAARLMDAGDSQTVAGHDEIRLRVGDAASVSFTVNGVAGKSLGGSGQAASIRITPQNVQEFQAK